MSHKVEVVCCDGRCSAHEGGCSEPEVIAVHLQCHFRLTASTFMGTATSVTAYRIPLVGHCMPCMGTASTFREIVGGTATTAGSPHPPSWALYPPSNILHSPSETLHPLHDTSIHIPAQCRGPCNHCRDTASAIMHTASSITTYRINL